MTILVGGDRGVMDGHKDILDIIGGMVIYTGGWGTASVVKVISNMLAAVQLVAVGEAFMLGKKAGIELPQLFDALKVGGDTPPIEGGAVSTRCLSLAYPNDASAAAAGKRWKLLHSGD